MPKGSESSQCGVAAEGNSQTEKNNLLSMSGTHVSGKMN